jgi:hypothetical protein
VKSFSSGTTLPPGYRPELTPLPKKSTKTVSKPSHLQKIFLSSWFNCWQDLAYELRKISIMTYSILSNAKLSQQFSFSLLQVHWLSILDLPKHGDEWYSFLCLSKL